MIDPRYDYKELHTNRRSGILLPLFSLPSASGIGSMGAAAYQFIDFLKKARQTYWQLLPLGPTGYGNSPYSSMSSFAGNPYFIDLELLYQTGLLTAAELHTADTVDGTGMPTDYTTAAAGGCRIDYGKLYRERLELLAKAYRRFTAEARNRALLDRFITEQADWLEDYALFSAVRGRFKDIPWYQWQEDIRDRKTDALSAARKDLQESFHFTVFVQYLFQTQWDQLKAYAHSAGIQIIGDIPIYCAHDSADVWAHPEVFCLSSGGLLAFVGGCPPADFDIPEDEGQVWGTPVYDWAYLEKTGFEWMLKRFARQADFFDVLRLDHFRGYESFWWIPFGTSARTGSWQPAGGQQLFSLLQHRLPQLQIIAEDLGYITKEVFDLRRSFGYPSMRILQQGLNPFHANEHTPHHYDAATVVYFGIHDNEPFAEWLSKRTPAERAYCCDYLNIAEHDSASPIQMQLAKAMAASCADTVIYQAQDLLFLGKEARINVPGRADGNWEFMLTDEQFKQLQETGDELARITRLYGRDHKEGCKV